MDAGEHGARVRSDVPGVHQPGPAAAEHRESRHDANSPWTDMRHR